MRPSILDQRGQGPGPDLRFHPYVHCIVIGGGLALDGSRWVVAKPDLLFPVRVRGAMFRGKFLADLERGLADGTIHDDVPDRATRRRNALCKKSWIVYAKRPFGGPQQDYRYLGRYTHRVATSNACLISDDDAIVFRTRGAEVASLTPNEFIGRFLEVLRARLSAPTGPLAGTPRAAGGVARHLALAAASTRVRATELDLVWCADPERRGSGAKDEALVGQGGGCFCGGTVGLALRRRAAPKSHQQRNSCKQTRTLQH